MVSYTCTKRNAKLAKKKCKTEENEKRCPTFLTNKLLVLQCLCHLLFLPTSSCDLLHVKRTADWLRQTGLLCSTVLFIAYLAIDWSDSYSIYLH